MKIVNLTPQEREAHYATHKVILDYTDVAALGASATGTIAIMPASGTFPIGTVVRFAGLQLITPFDFSDAAINSLLAEVGDGGSTARHLSQTELAADGSYVTNKVSTASTAPYAYLAADTVDCKFTAAGGASPTLAECTSGKFEIYLNVSNQANLLRAK